MKRSKRARQPLTAPEVRVPCSFVRARARRGSVRFFEGTVDHGDRPRLVDGELSHEQTLLTAIEAKRRIDAARDDQVAQTSGPRLWKP